MNYSIENYPHLVKIINVDPFGMAFVCDNMTGKCFRTEQIKLIK